MIVNSKDLVPFSCKATGRCCIHNVVLLSSFDIFRMARFLGLTAKELFDKKLITYRINSFSFWMEPILNSRTKPTCPFLVRDLNSDTEKYICDVYEARPLVCRIYPLKYDKDQKVFMRFLPAEYRCAECLSFEKNQTLYEYLESSNSYELVDEFNSYLTLIDFILSKGFTIDKIKKNKEAQKKFFEIQSILYESYPDNHDLLESLPFAAMQSRIEEIVRK